MSSEYHHKIHISKTPQEKQELRKTIIQKFMTKYRVSDNMIKTTDTVIQPSSSENVFEYVKEEPDRNRTFQYLEDDPLSRIETDVDVSKNIKLFLYLYKIEENFEDPFLEVLFVKKDKMYTLPNTELPPLEESDNETENPLFERISLFFEKSTGESQDDAVRKYKGFVETEDEFRNKCIVAVFGPMGDAIMPVEKNATEENNQPIWAIVDEIFFKTRILDVPIKEFIIKMVNDKPSLVCIKDQDGNTTTPPYLMYMCVNDANVFYKDGEERGETYDLLLVRKNHEFFNSTFMFSSEPFEYNNLSKIKRYAVVIKDPLYLLNDDFPVTEFKNVDTNRTISFYEGSRELWSVKNENLIMQL